MSRRKSKGNDSVPDRGQEFEVRVREALLRAFAGNREGRRGNLLVRVPDDKSALFSNLEAKVFQVEGGLALQAEIDAVFFVEKAAQSYFLFGHEVRIRDDSIVAFEVTCSKDSLDKCARKCVQIAILSQVLWQFPEQVFPGLLAGTPKQVYFFLVVENRLKIARCLRKSLEERTSKKVKQALDKLSSPECSFEGFNGICVIGTDPPRKPKVPESSDTDYILLRKGSPEFGDGRISRQKESWASGILEVNKIEPKIAPKKAKKKDKKLKNAIIELTLGDQNEEDLLLMPRMSRRQRKHLFGEDSPKALTGSSGVLYSHSPKSSLQEERSEEDKVQFCQSRLELLVEAGTGLNEEIKARIRNESASLGELPPHHLPNLDLPPRFVSTRPSSLVELLFRQHGVCGLMWPSLHKAATALSQLE